MLVPLIIFFCGCCCSTMAEKSPPFLSFFSTHTHTIYIFFFFGWCVTADSGAKKPIASTGCSELNAEPENGNVCVVCALLCCCKKGLLPCCLFLDGFVVPNRRNAPWDTGHDSSNSTKKQIRVEAESHKKEEERKKCGNKWKCQQHKRNLIR